MDKTYFVTRGRKKRKRKPGAGSANKVKGHSRSPRGPNAGKRTVIVELSKIDELGSSLVGVLVRIQRSLNWRNGRLLIACESPTIRHQLADLNDLFEFVDERPHRR